MPKIRIVFFDIDGVFTDGTTMYREDGTVIKQFHGHDSSAIKLLHAQGIRTVFVSADERVNRVWAEHQHVPFVFSQDKVAAVREAVAEYGCGVAEAAFVGDDLRDLEAMKLVAYSFAPTNAIPAVRAVATHPLTTAGGAGAAREVVDLVLAINKEGTDKLTNAVILAAGIGTRLGSLTEKIPKCLIPFGEQTLLEHTLQELSQAGFDNVVVVAGYKHEQLAMVVENIVVNKEFAVTQPPYSLRLGLRRVTSGAVLVLDADIIFEQRVLQELLKQQGKSFVVTYTAGSRVEPGSRVNVQGNKVFQIGRYISPPFPWPIHAGITVISAEDLDFYKELAELDTFRTTEMHVLLNKFCQERELLAVNMEQARVEKTTGTLALDGGSFADINITEQDSIIRKESSKDTKRLINELDYLRNIPDKLQPYFTELLESDVASCPVWYTMPHYPEPSLKKLILSGHFSALDAVEILTRIVKFLVENVYTRRRADAPASFTNSVHFHRVAVRREMTLERAPIFQSIFGASRFIINGLEFENPFNIIGKIRERRKLLGSLHPPYLAMIHGDLHFDNLLVDTQSVPPGFRLVDPKGFSAGDPLYDIAKLFHDFHGLYDFVYEYMFDLDWSMRGDVVEAEFGVQRCQALQEFEKINQYFPTIVAQFFEADVNWFLRMKFIEAIHFCCLQPFHLQGDNIEAKAIAMFLTGVQCMNDFWRMCSEELKRREDRFRLVNVNTLDDYTHAQNLFEGGSPSV